MVKESLGAVLPDGFNRTSFKSFDAELSILLCRRLRVHKGVTALFMSLEKRRRGLTAKIAIYALLIDVKLPRGVVLPFFCFIGHLAGHSITIPPPVKKSRQPVSRGTKSGAGGLYLVAWDLSYDKCCPIDLTCAMTISGEPLRP